MIVILRNGRRLYTCDMAAHFGDQKSAKSVQIIKINQKVLRLHRRTGLLVNILHLLIHIGANPLPKKSLFAFAFAKTVLSVESQCQRWCLGETQAIVGETQAWP